MIPPKITRARGPQVTFKYEEAADWYFVRSPRAEGGAVGPVSLDDLKELYSETEINNTTLCVVLCCGVRDNVRHGEIGLVGVLLTSRLWKVGMHDWKQLGMIHEVVHAVTTLPPIPNSAEEMMLMRSMRDLAIATDPSVQQIETPVLTAHCIHCGNPAELHLAGKAGNRSMETLRKAQGNTESSTEILPDFLWVGNRASLKQTYVLDKRAHVCV